jgi:cytochrome c553
MIATPGVTTPPDAIIWDAEFKEKTATYGDTNAVIVFWLTNKHSAEVVINSVRPSCGCTVAKLPAQPWHIKPGESGPIEASLDLRGKFGTLTKSLYVDTSSGSKTLLFKVTVPDRQGAITMSDPDRLRNVQLATADRQVVFKNADCAKCHAEPAHGKGDAPLYQAACAICHDTAHRATMVPDLRALKHPTNSDYWRTWIKYGRAGSLMPAFAKSQGGPLTDDQIESLVNYLVRITPSLPQPANLTKPPGPAADARSGAAVSSASTFAAPKGQ